MDARISAAILARMAGGMTVCEAFDSVLGAGAFDRLAGEIFDTMRAAAKGGAS